MSFHDFLGVLVVLGVVLIAFVLCSYLNFYIRALLSHVHMPFTALVSMRFRRVPARVVIDALIRAKQAGVTITAEQLESHHLAGGDVEKSVEALIRETSHITFADVAAADLAGRDISRMSADEIRRAARQRSSES